MSDKLKFQRNPRRGLNSDLNKEVYGGYQPEHKRYGIDPIVAENVKDDFMFANRRQARHQAPKPAPKRQERSPQHNAVMDQPTYQQAPQRIEPVTYGHPWQRAPERNPDYDPSMVPDPPSTPFTHSQGAEWEPSPPPPVAQQAPQQPAHMLSSIAEGDFCVFVRDSLVFTTSSPEEAEHTLEQLIFGDKPIPIEDIVIMQRLNLKVGAHIS